jgi:hypothetical protein
MPPLATGLRALMPPCHYAILHAAAAAMMPLLLIRHFDDAITPLLMPMPRHFADARCLILMIIISAALLPPLLILRCRHYADAYCQAAAIDYFID